MADLDTLKAKGVATPLTIGGTWTQVELFETVLISDLGPGPTTVCSTARPSGMTPRSRPRSTTTPSC